LAYILKGYIHLDPNKPEEDKRVGIVQELIAKSKVLFGRSLADLYEKSGLLGSEVGYHVVEAVLKKYSDILQNSNALDFEDILVKGRQLLVEAPDVCANIRHVLVDEL
jgi:superfamily I DNA/RNA helicase